MLILYALPSITALILKLCIFWFGRNQMKSTSHWLVAFFICLFGINSMELLSFYFSSNPETGFFGLIFYYIFVLAALFSLLTLSLQNIHKLNRWTKTVLACLFIISITPLVIPNTGLAGAKSIGYSVTRIPGPYYFVVQLGILLPLIGSIGVLLYGAWFSADDAKRKSRLLLLSCLPIFLGAITVLLLMQLGYAINAAVIMSMMITITMLIILLNERKHPVFQIIDRRHIYQFTRLIPRSTDHHFVKQMVKLVTNPGIGLTKGKELIEQEMIREALATSNGNKTKAANLLGISRQTLVRLLEKQTGT